MTWRDDWICPGGHPYYLIDGVKTCWVCDRIAEVGAKERGCKADLHQTPLGTSHCVTCEKWRKRAWSEELDTVGKAVCPDGHEITHETLKYMLGADGIPQRRCAECAITGRKRATASYVASREEHHAKNGTLMRRQQEKVRLPLDYFDWVVSLRLIEGKVDEVYDMMRGKHKGATAMEKWVAYHSVPRDFSAVRHLKSGETTGVHLSWATVGIARGWKPKTLAQAMAEMGE